MKNFFLFFLLITSGLFAQVPANDNCSTATDLGTLPAPAACTSTVTQTGTNVSVNTTNVNATSENPYVTLTGCTGGTMSSPANEVWYKFVAPTNGYGCNVMVTGATFSTPNIALWTGTCSTLTGMGCQVGSSGSATLTVASNIVPGQTYYIQVSGATAQTGTFNLAVNCFQDCADCNNASALTVNPAPVNGVYQPGQSVTFCYHISKWTEVNQNWLHGVQMSFGNGWDLTTLTTSAPGYAYASCGTWTYYPLGITSTSTLSGTQSWPAGFYFDGTAAVGHGCASQDGNPGNNYGDGAGLSGSIDQPTSAQWNFCWTVSVKTGCNPGANLSCTVTSSGDGESGGYTGNGCTNDPPTVFSAVQACCPPTVASTSVLCNGGTTGASTASVVIGSAGTQQPYTYVWTSSSGTVATTSSTSSQTNTATSLPAGTYTVTVTDKNLCAATQTLTIVQPTALTATVTPTNATCSTGGSFATSASGGTSPYTYHWSGPSSYTSSTQNPSGLNPGTYTLTVTDNHSCTYTTTATITQTGSITVTATSGSVCAGSALTLTAGGATTYSWSTSATTSTISVSPGSTTSYTVTGTTGSCTNTAVGTATIVPHPTVTATSTSVCPGVSGTLTAGGATTYTWSTTATTTTISAAPASTTSYTVTGTTAGCTGTAVGTITVNPTPTITVTSPTICSGTSTSFTASGASTYTWSPATGLSATTGSAVTANPTTTTAYTITGSSAASCTSTTTATVTVNPTPTITVGSATICPGASTNLNASGASTYTWSPSATLSASTGSTVVASPTATTVYTISGTSAASCTSTTTATVTIGGSIVPSVANATICAGSSTTLSATGGTSYTWTPSSSLSASTGSSVSANPTVTTTYTITAASGACTGTTTAVVTVNPMPTVAVNSPSICIGGSTSLNASGASSYSWTPATGLSATTGSTVTASPTVTTTYTVVGTSLTCTAQAVATVTVNPLPTISVTTGSYCAGGSAALTASGASTYTWSPGTGLSATTGSAVTANPASSTNYTVTGTSAAGCVNTGTTSVTVAPNPTLSVASATICVNNSTTLNASGATTYTWSPATGLSANTGTTVTANPTTTTIYTITGTSGTCTSSTTATVTVNPLPVVSVNSATICVGQQTATLTANGATSYTWTPSTGLSSSNGSPVTATPVSTTNYTVSGTDANGCVNTATTAVTVNPLPTVNVNNGIICVGDNIVLTASGANTYSWSPGTDLSATTGASVAANPTVTTTYTVTGTSTDGCVNTNTTTITVVTTPTVTVASATICINGSTTLNANGATTYSWSPITGLSSSTGSSVTANPTVTTTYTITGTAGTCTDVTTAVVNVNPLPVVTATSGTICVGQQTATLTANGATTYTWSPSTGLSSANGSPVNATPTTGTSYTVSGTDANGCVNTATAAVTVNPLPTITLNSGFICNGSTATLTAGGASTYTWNPGTGLSSTTGSTVSANPSSTTQYTVTGTDANGCVNSDTTRVTVVSNPTVTVASATVCVGSSTTLNATGASTYVWTPGTGLSSTTGTSVSANPTATTVYTITGTAGTCTAVTTTTVNVNPLPTIVVGSNGPRCVNDSLDLTASGGVAYNWAGPSGFTSTNQNPIIGSVTQAGTGTYSVVVTDANGCVNSNMVSVVVNPLPVVVATGATVCVGFTINLSTNNSGVQYSWNGPNGFFSNLQNPSIPNASTNMSGSYFVTVRDGNGCYSGNSANVQVNSTPPITASNTGPVCEGATLNLSAGSGQTYIWSGPNGFTSTLQAPSIPNVTLGATGTYTVAGTDAFGCVGTATTSALINPLPTIGVNTATICATQGAANLTATGALTYTWSPASSLNSATGNPVIATPLATTVYTVTATDANSCVNAATTTVTVNQLPIITANSAAICNGSSTTLTANGASSYTWSPATGLSSTTINPVSANPTSTTTYTVIGQDAATGCTNFGVCTVTVNPLPVVSASSATICNGATGTLVASGANTYSWNPSLGLSSTTGATVTASPGTTTPYTVMGTDLNGCVNTATAVVTVNPLPVVEVGPPHSGCSPVCVTLANTVTTTVGSCAWSFGDGTIGTACSALHCFSGQGTFNAVLIVTDSNGCKGVDTAKIIVYPLPHADFNYGPTPTTVLESTINFYDNSSGGYITSWQWTFGDPGNHGSAVQNPSFNYNDPGTYPVTLTVTTNYGCTDTVTRFIIIGEDYSIYIPNAFSPNSDGINDSFGAKGEGIKEFKMYIFDRWGNQVFFSEKLDDWWDGRFQSKGTEIVQEDVYVWKVELKTFKNDSRLLKGTVTLIK